MTDTEYTKCFKAGQEWNKAGAIAILKRNICFDCDHPSCNDLKELITEIESTE